jgi:hypothetical protein
MKWISTKDRLPAHAGKVQIFPDSLRDCRASVGYYSAGVWTDLIFDGTTKVTHWAPLLEKPE